MNFRGGLLAIILLLLGTTLAQEPTPVVLRVNDFYVLYTPPVSPYRDSAGRVMVSLSGFAELIADWQREEAKVRNYRIVPRWERVDWYPLHYQKDGSALLRFGNRLLRFVPGRAAIELVGQGKSVPLPGPPQVVQGELVVPLRPLAEALGITVTWNSQHQLAMIRNYRLLYYEEINAIDWAKRPRTNYLVPVAYRLTPLAKEGGPYDFELWVKDLSPAGIPEEQEGIFIIANGEGFTTGSSYLGRQKKDW